MVKARLETLRAYRWSSYRAYAGYGKVPGWLGVNLYGFVENDGLNWVDVSGLFRWHGRWGGPNWTGGFRKSWDEMTEEERGGSLL
jgi:hypothetical protein